MADTGSNNYLSNIASHSCPPVLGTNFKSTFSIPSIHLFDPSLPHVTPKVMAYWNVDKWREQIKHCREGQASQHCPLCPNSICTFPNFLSNPRWPYAAARPFTHLIRVVPTHFRTVIITDTNGVQSKSTGSIYIRPTTRSGMFFFLSLHSRWEVLTINLF